MGTNDKKGDEAAAIMRVAEASREVQSASRALEQHFHDSNDTTRSTLPLARLTACIDELQAARDALDALLARKQSGQD
jgi:hypothetical protein